MFTERKIVVYIQGFSVRDGIKYETFEIVQIILFDVFHQLHNFYATF